MSKVLLKAHAIKVYNLLTKYVELHNTLLKLQATFFSVLRNIFKPIDFGETCNNSLDLLREIENELNELLEIECIILKEDKNEKCYYDCLVSFLITLASTVNILNKRQQLLYARSQGKRLPYSQYSALEDEYQQSIENYVKIGIELNEMSTKIY